MSYFLYFAQTLHRENSNVIHDREKFADNPVRVSTPKITEMIQRFISKFEPIAIVEPSSNIKGKTGELEKESPSANDYSHNGAKSSTALKTVAGKAYICSQKTIDKLLLQDLFDDLANSLATSTSNLTGEDLISDSTDILVSEIREILEVRNYLKRFMTGSKKIYKDGYIYVTTWSSYIFVPRAFFFLNHYWRERPAIANLMAG